MKIVKNEGIQDRLIRVIVSEIFFILAFFWLGGIWQIVFYIFSLVMIVTAILGFCGLYTLLNINTKLDKPASKIFIGVLIALFIIIALFGSYYSNFFTKKFFLEDYNGMNQYYKQTLFYTGQEMRSEGIDNYNKLIDAYRIFNDKYQEYHPYIISRDIEFNGDLSRVSNIFSGLSEKINSGDLKSAHLDLEQVRPIFQDILKRNGFSMLAVYLVDFHDAMEKIIAKADAKDPAGLIEVYPEVDEKLKAVEEVANDSEIQVIREKLTEVLNFANEGKSDLLSAKASELKSSFVKVYLKRG